MIVSMQADCVNLLTDCLKIYTDYLDSQTNYPSTKTDITHCRTVFLDFQADGTEIRTYCLKSRKVCLVIRQTIQEYKWVI